MFADPVCDVGTWSASAQSQVRHGIIELDFDPTRPAEAVSFGVGCPGTSAATPALASEHESLPRLGTVYAMEARSIPDRLFNVPFGLLGYSNTQLPSGVQLPVNLSVVGAPGCDLLVSADDASLLANNGGTATWNLSIPLIRDIAGVSVFTQVAVLAPGANALGLVVTNGLRLTLGY
jgi:hypothetical protein